MHTKYIFTTMALACLFTIAGCQNAPPRALAAVVVATSEDFKDSRFQGSDDSTDTGWGIRGIIDPGQKEKVVLEGGYAQFGDTTFDGTFNGVSDSGRIETKVVDANIGYRYPITDQFSAGGRVGAAYTDVDEREIFGGFPESSSASKTVPYGGVTARFQFTDRFAISAHYDRYFDVGEKNKTGEGDIDVFGLQFELWFGNTDR